MRLKIIFLKKNKEWAMVIVKGDFPRPNTFIWKPMQIENIPDVDSYVSFRKFMNEENTEKPIESRKSLFMTIYNHVDSYNNHTMWVHKDSVL